MDKWTKIKNKIHQEKIEEVNSIFNAIISNSYSKDMPRYDWPLPLENWTTRQIKNSNSLKLSLCEFVKLKKIVENLQIDFALNVGKEQKIINESRDLFIKDYVSILESKNNDIKLEISAELIEEKQFQLEEFVVWYEEAHKLSPKQFNEALGDFWGDVWRHAAHGAGAGGLAGSFVGGLPGTFAGAGIGGLAGGLYGGTSSLLKRVWHWRQTQRNFEQTKEKAIELLKKLKELSKGFSINPNFIQSLDSIIDQLGTVKAYRMAPVTHDTETQPTTPEPESKKPMPGLETKPTRMPMPPEVEPTPSPTPTATPASITPTPSPTPTATPASITPTPSPTPTATPTPATPTFDEVPPSEETPVKPKRTIRLKAAERKAAAAAGGSTEAPSEVAPGETPGEEIKNSEDLVKFYDKHKDDPVMLSNIGTALYGTYEKGTPLNFEDFKQYLNKAKQFNNNNDVDDNSVNMAKEYFNDLKILTDLGTKETYADLVAKSRNEFLKYIEDNNLQKFVPKSESGKPEVGEDKRFEALNAIATALGGKVYKPETETKAESIFSKYKRIIKEHKLATLPIESKVSYLISMIRS